MQDPTTNTGPEGAQVLCKSIINLAGSERHLPGSLGTAIGRRRTDTHLTSADRSSIPQRQRTFFPHLQFLGPSHLPQQAVCSTESSSQMLEADRRICATVLSKETERLALLLREILWYTSCCQASFLMAAQGFLRRLFQMFCRCSLPPLSGQAGVCKSEQFLAILCFRTVRDVAKRILAVLLVTYKLEKNQVMKVNCKR